MWFPILELLILSLTVIIIYYKYCFRYWKVRNVPHVAPTFPFGNYKDHILQKLSIREQNSKILSDYIKIYKKCDSPYFGIYVCAKPVLLILSPELLKKVFVEDFEYFNRRVFYYHEKNDPLSANIFFLGGEQWKFIRSKVSPTFTSSKIKVMFNRMVDCAKHMEEQLKQYENGETFEIRDMMFR